MEQPEMTLEELQVELNNMEQTIKGVKDIRIDPFNDNNEAAFMIMDVLLFIYLYSYEILSYYKYYTLARTEFEQKMICRHLSVSYYEFLEDILELLGGEFRTSIVKKIPEVDFKDMNELVKRINVFKTQNVEQFKSIRNFITAHKDHDPLKQLELINKINVEQHILSIGFFTSFFLGIQPFLLALLAKVENKR